MSIQSELFTKLSGTAGVSALVATRIRPVKLPHGYTLPAIVYTRITSPRIYHLGGASGRTRTRFQIDSWATTEAAASNVADAVRAALSGFNGTLTTLKAVIHLEREQDQYDADAEAFGVSQDYIFNHTE